MEEKNLNKLNIMAYQAPYLGTIIASPLLLYKRIDDIISEFSSTLLKSFISDGELDDFKSNSNNEMQGIAELAKNIYWNTFSKSHMDYDISDIGGKGVPNSHKNRYDEKLLRNMFDEKTLKMLKKVHFTNITTFCTEETLKYALKTKNTNEGMLYLSAKLLFNKEISDGFVALKSSSYIEEVCKMNGISIERLRIDDGHHDILGDVRIIGEVIDNVLKIK